MKKKPIINCLASTAATVSQTDYTWLMGRLWSMKPTDGDRMEKTLQNAVENGYPPTKAVLLSCIKQFRKHNRVFHALKVSEWMLSRGMCAVESVDHAVHLDILARAKGIGAAEEHFERLPSDAKDYTTYVWLLSCYCNQLVEEKALALSRKFCLLQPGRPRVDPCSWHFHLVCVVGDTCIAMDEWVQNPTAKTALDDIIPCVDNTTAQETLNQTKSVTYELVKELDGVISNLSNRNFPPVAVPLYYNQSGPLVPLVCNPFNADYSSRHCAVGEVDLGNAIQVLMNYTCQVSSSGICTTTGRLTPSLYSQMAAAVNISYGLYRYGPFLVELEDCTFVRQTFTEISSSYCPKLRRYTEWIYIGLVIVSAAVMLSLVFWVIYARERRHRVYTGEGKFHSITTNTLDYVVSQANVTTENLRNVSGYLAAAKNVSLNSAMLSPSVQNGIDNIDAKINSSASTLSTRTQKNSKDIDDALDLMGLSLVILAAVMLALAFIGFLCSIFGLQCLVYSLVVLGWILVAGTFILCGVFLLIHNVVADTCIAMDEWVQNPTAKTALDDIIPCVDNTTAQETLNQTKSVTYELVKELDGVISNLSNRNFPPVAVPLYYNQSGPLVPLVCNPFNADYSTRHCAAGEVDLGNATQVLMNYTCQVSSSGICTTTGRLTPSLYSQMAAAVNISYGLYRYGPFLVELEDCTFVRQTFTEISSSYCPKLRRYTEWIYIGLVIVSAAVMLSLVFWVIYARERRHRVYTKQHDGMMQRNDPDKDY